MSSAKDVVYSEARSGHWPPYMIDFQNSVGERHAENLKVRSPADPYDALF